MNQEIGTERETGQLIEDTQALHNATTHGAGEKVVEARTRLAGELENVKRTCGAIQKRAVAGAGATDRAIRTHPYQTMGIALGIGTVIGYMLARRSK
jgi:ElaB/YqjD/DUF883 family membrane-anchored ribosome-binding protein